MMLPEFRGSYEDEIPKVMWPPKSAGSKKQNEDNLRDYKTRNYYGHPMGNLVRIMEYDRVTS
jgi:hypothetical protein